MSTTEIAGPTTLLCPACGGGIEASQTICDVCRSAMEKQVMAVRAGDYPRLFQNAEQDPAEAHRNPIDPARMDMLKIADQTDDLALVPLAPVDEPRKNGADADGATASSNETTAAVSSAMAVAIPMASYPEPGKGVGQMNRPTQAFHGYASSSKLEPANRWTPVVIAVACVAAAIILAMVFWSVLVPRHGANGSGEPGVQEPTAPSKTAPAR